MASISSNLPLFFFTMMHIFCFITCPTVIEDLNNLKPPPDFNTTITNNCINNPSLRYCSNATTPYDLLEIFQSTIVASHLCNISRNPNCVESFPKIDLHNKPKIAPLYLSFDFFWKYCPLTIISIDVSNNSLQGKFPSQFFYCSQIHDLDLSNNSFSGDVPIENFSSLPNLTFLNLSYNLFWESGNENSELFKRFNSTSFIHSGILINHIEFRLKVLLLLVVFPIFVLAMVSFLCWLCFSRPDYLPCCFQRRYKFTPSMLKAATSGFSKKKLMGKSNSVDVYYGVLRDGTEVRIEVYKDNLSSEDSRMFDEGCSVLTQLSHKNLVRVLGWCANHKFRAIVSEWIDAENVETWLANSAPSWKHRMKIMMGILQGMRYVNEEWPQVECDLKTKNILLNNNGEPLISRFKVYDENNSKEKVYKFGVFILEMVSNKKPWEDFENGEVGFLQWLKLHYPHNLQTVIDERMKKTEIVIKQATEVIQLGLLCTDQSNVHEQPNWDQISYVLSKNSCLVLEPSNHRRYQRSDAWRKEKLMQEQDECDDDDDDNDEIEMDSHVPCRSVVFH